MLDIEKLPIDELYDLNKAITKKLEDFKVGIKLSKEGINLDKYEVVYNTFPKIKAVDILKLLERYPIDKYPEMYTISLSASAGDIITDDSLVTREEQERVEFKKKK